MIKKKFSFIFIVLILVSFSLAGFKFWSTSEGKCEPLYFSRALDVRFGSTELGTQFLRGGWNDPENWGVWSKSKISTLEFCFGLDNFSSLRFKTRIRPNLTPSHPEREIRLVANGEEVSRVLLTSDEWKDVNFVLENLPDSKGRLVLEFFGGEPFPPITTPNSSDLRLLSIALQHMSIEKLDENES